MRKILILILSFSFLLLFANKGKSQDITLKEVSVINEQGHVRLRWEYNGTDTVYIYRDELIILQSTVEIAEITDQSIKSYIDITAEAHTKPRAYRIKNSSDNSDIVSTYFLTSDYDSCLNQVSLIWRDLDDFNPPFPTNNWIPSQFFININEDGDLRKIPVSASENEYTINNLLENVDYSIFIETKWSPTDTDSDSTSKSNPINFFTQMPIRPDYINAISTVIDGNNTNIKFNIDPNTELDTYKLLKSDSKTGSFDTLETYTTAESQIIASDINSNPNSEINYYKLISLNQCGNKTDSSNVINNLVLEAELEDFDVYLKWNDLNEGSLIPIDYTIYRVIGNMEHVYIGSRPSNHTYFTDDIEDFQDYTQFCYYIRATESGTPIDDFSQSNIACVYLKPKVYIPEAFTPNDDGINDLFQAVFSFIPKEFEIKIYNRWGNIVFETRDYSQAWDGKVPNGNSAPTASYIYYIRIKTPNDQVVEQRGSVMVIHP
ncbi:MAG: T9SS type B sorting domain-containing protein [Bacteroidales bacterium]|nr:T9SS type B sorting domain-containing protein [Bacteroidales bacterium]